MHSDETEIRELIAPWAKAVREEDLAGIRADHEPEMLMFDVPPPFTLRGLDAYMATWNTSFSWSEKLVAFDFHDVEITAGQNVAEKNQLEFRLTIGFRKRDGRWRIVHEHHSLRAID